MAGAGSRASFVRRLLHWFSRHGRDLPWRRTRDPYRILVSEVMLQQTQVSRVLEYYPRFLDRFPTIEHLARARPKSVMEAWDGLGYYARARNLHATAKESARRLGGSLPDTPEELVKLPGLGRYTAGAVASFAYEKPVAAVDTNVARVIRRYFWGEGKTENVTPRQLWDVAEQIVPRNGKRAWTFNQAIMELGAVICKARTPMCTECPVRLNCRTGGRR